VAVALAALFFFAPAAAYAVGVRPAAIENRPLRSLPGISAGWSFFAQTSAWAIDRLPLRDRAVRGNVALSEGVFGQPPSYGSGDTGPVSAPQPVPQSVPEDATATNGTYPRILQGTDGWLYLGGDVAAPCQPQMTVRQVLDRLGRLARAVQRSGRRFVFTVAPDKSTIWPANLPVNYLGKDCAGARKDEFWSALRADPPPGYFDMRAAIEARQVETGQPQYWRNDTHWGQWAAATYAVELAQKVDPTGFAVLPPISCPGTVTHIGDLSVYAGAPSADTMPACQIDTPGRPVTGALVAPEGLALPSFGGTPARVSARYAAGTGQDPVRANTLLLGDSFSINARPYVLPLFVRLTVLHNEQSRYNPREVANAMVRADVVAYEIVERSVVRGATPLLSDASLAAVERALAAHPRR
jgi:hypothetical protein